MDYEKVISEMLERISVLEEQVRSLTAEKDTAQKLGTADVKSYIMSLKNKAAVNNARFIELKANDIHNSLGLKCRMPIVCNAMKQSMTEKDVITHSTASGYSSTLTIRYYLNS